MEMPVIQMIAQAPGGQLRSSGSPPDGLFSEVLGSLLPVLTPLQLEGLRGSEEMKELPQGGGDEEKGKKESQLPLEGYGLFGGAELLQITTVKPIQDSAEKRVVLEEVNPGLGVKGMNVSPEISLILPARDAQQDPQKFNQMTLENTNRAVHRGLKEMDLSKTPQEGILVQESRDSKTQEIKKSPYKLAMDREGTKVQQKGSDQGLPETSLVSDKQFTSGDKIIPAGFVVERQHEPSLQSNTEVKSRMPQEEGVSSEEIYFSKGTEDNNNVQENNNSFVKMESAFAKTLQQEISSFATEDKNINLPAEKVSQELPRIIEDHFKSLVTKESPGKDLVIQLEPKELGKLTVKLTAQEGIVSVKIVAESAESRSILENGLQNLRQSFSEQGIKYGRMDIELGGQNVGQHHQPNQQNHHPNWQQGQSSGFGTQGSETNHFMEMDKESSSGYADIGIRGVDYVV